MWYFSTKTDSDVRGKEWLKTSSIDTVCDKNASSLIKHMNQ